jgi:hypothetical protein
VVGQVGERQGTAILDALGAEAGLGVDVAAQRDDALAVVEQALGKPGAEKALRSCDERAQGDSAAGDRGQDRDLVAVLDARLEALEEADVLAPDVDVHEPA